MLASTKVIAVLTLLAASVSGASINHGSNQLAHKRHADVTRDAVLQARGARKRDMSGFAKIAAREEVAKMRVKKRGTNARRCAMKTSSGISSTVSATAEPTSTPAAKSKQATTSVEDVTSAEPTTTSATKTKTKTSSAPEPTTPPSSGGGSSGESHTGEATFYGTGLGACGITNKDTDYICAVSQLLFDGFEGYTGGDPNSNPICGRKIKATYKGKTVTVAVTDRCVGCKINDLDFAPSAFDQLASQDLGRLQGLTWVWA